MTPQLILYAGRLAAVAAADRWWLAPDLERRPVDDPERRMVTLMVACAHDVAEGRLPGPYTDELARAYARHALLPPRALRGTRCDAELAERLAVPIGEVRTARHELVAASPRAQGPARRPA